jgi:T5SS/PEP-CTERM-associated repeat protein
MGNAAASNAYMLVDNSATVSAFGETLGLKMGVLAGNVSVLDLKGGTTTISCGDHQNLWGIGFVSGATGIVNVTGGNHTWSSGSAEGCSLGFNAGAVGKMTLAGGSLTVNSIFYVGRSGSGEMRVTGGTWNPAAGLSIGSYAAGSTGMVSVANCVSATNITGAVTVGGGTTGGNRYGSVTVSNATFGGGTAVSVLTNGFVELTGTGSVFLCNTFTCRGGTVTNYVQGMAGGVDVTNSANTALVVTNGARMHLVFGDVPATQGDFWGLRWAGNNHAGQLQGMTNSGLSWDDTALVGNVKIYTNATHTMVGYVSPASGSTFRFR